MFSNSIVLIVEIIIAIATLASILFGIVKFIDYRISKKLGDPEFVKSISQLLRPYAIFNSKREIIVDHGAMAFLHDIEIEIVKDTEHDLIKEITLKLKAHHSTAPILLSLDESMSTITERRGEMFDWIYAIDYTGYSINEDDLIGRRFIVEIVT